MELIKSFVDLFIHLDHHVAQLAAAYGPWIYGILFAIIFSETGFIITPFLPGDSLLFVVGALTANGTLRLDACLGLLSVAAITGNMVNYSVGKMLSAKVLNQESIPFVKKEHINRTHAFYEKYGAKAIIITRFVPIVRTFAPFMAGVGDMSYAKFTSYNLVGGLLWVFVGVLCGYFFGNLPFVAKNFSLVVLIIVIISLVPAAIEIMRIKR